MVQLGTIVVFVSKMPDKKAWIMVHLMTTKTCTKTGQNVIAKFSFPAGE